MTTTPRSQPDQALNRTLERLREERGITREMLAHEAGLTSSAYHRLETGKTAPQWATVRRVAEALGVSLKQLAEAVEAEERS